MLIATLVFPGTWSDHDCHYVLTQILGQESERVWHTETDLSRFDAIVLPGGFSYGDYLRTGAIARFSPVMEAVAREADRGKPVVGSCNGFQILCEAGLLPGALMRNDNLQFRCQPVQMRVETIDTPFTSEYSPGQVVTMPIAHGEGLYHADADTLRELNDRDRIVFRYSTANGEVTPDANPNGSIENIAGIVNERRNVLGLMPHPERVSEKLMGGEDGLPLWRSMLKAATAVAA
jgi:phosphoribosylformylglycinamidine synthase